MNDLKGPIPQIPRPTFALMRTSDLEQTRRYYDKLFKVVERWRSIRPELCAGAWPKREQIDELVGHSMLDGCGNRPRVDELTGEVVFMSSWRETELETKDPCNQDQVQQPDTVIWVHIDGDVVPIDNDGRVLRANQHAGTENLYNLHMTLEEQRLQQVKLLLVNEAESQEWVLDFQSFGGAKRDLELEDITGALERAHKVHTEVVQGHNEMRIQLDLMLAEQFKNIQRLENELKTSTITRCYARRWTCRARLWAIGTRTRSPP